MKPTDYIEFQHPHWKDQRERGYIRTIEPRGLRVYVKGEKYTGYELRGVDPATCVVLKHPKGKERKPWRPVCGKGSSERTLRGQGKSKGKKKTTTEGA